MKKIKKFIKNLLNKDLITKDNLVANLPTRTINNSVVSEKAILFDGINLHNSEVGDYSYIALNSIIHNCKIGKFSSIGPQVIVGYGDHPTNFVSTSPAFYGDSHVRFGFNPEGGKYKGDALVEIGNDVWIGANCYIKNDVKIGDGAIVGSGAIVLKDIPAYHIYAGVPARFIKKRFSDDEISRLQTIKWWDWELEIIKQRINDIGSADVNHFIKAYST